MNKNEEKELWKEIEKEDQKRAFYYQRGRDEIDRTTMGCAIVFVVMIIIGTIIMIIKGEI